MSDVSPDDLTAHGQWRAERVWHKHHERIPDRWEWLIEDDAGVVAILPDDDAAHAESVARFIVEAPVRVAALSADVARLTAERDTWHSSSDEWASKALAWANERDEARARVAERDATIERQRRAVQEHRHRVRASDDRYTRAICFDLWRSVLAETAPTPEVPDV